MLSNKLTFSLVFLIMFAVAFTVTPVMAQRVNEVPTATTATTADGYTIGTADGGFFLIQTAANNGILVAGSDPDRPISTGTGGNLVTVATQTNVAASTGVPDLEDFFSRGGTIDVIVPIMGMYEQADDRWHDVVVTEIMWGLDWRPAGTTGVIEPHTDKQWIELYNNSGPVAAYKDVDARGDKRARAAVDGVRLLFTNNIFLGTNASESPPKAAKYIGVYVATTGAPNTPLTYAWLDSRPTWDAAADAAVDASPGPGAFTAVNPPMTDPAITHFTAVYKVVDRVGNLGRGGRQGPMPGQSGSTAKNIAVDTVENETLGTVVDGTYVPLISAYRKRVLLLDDQTGIGTYHDGHAFGKGTDLGQWMESWVSPNAIRRRNIEDPYIGTPGAEHLTPKLPDPTVVPVNVVFNEIRNDTSEDDLDWIELYNNSSVDVDIGAYEISIVTKDKKDTDLIGLQDKDDDGVDIKLGAGEYLLILNRDPEDSILADGKDITINATNRLKLQGAEHLYYVPDADWELPNTEEGFLLILRTAKDKNGSPDAIADVVGDLRIEDLRDDLDTKVWPLRNWGAVSGDGEGSKSVGEAKDADFGAKADGTGGNSFGSRGRSSMTWYRAKYEAGLWWHQDHWKQAGYQGGIGYRKDLDHGVELEAPGTPGYVNAIQGTLADHMKVDAGAEVSISEIMYDAGRAWDLVQWIELYNSSMTEAVDISNWTLDIRNAADDEEPQRSFVDDEFEFEAGTIIPPNRTLLVVSATGATNVPANRVYDLFARHGNDLGLKNLARRTYLLSKTGFRLKLMDDAIEPQEVDTAGNASLDGARVTTEWELPPVSEEGEARHSIIRLYGAIYNPTKSGTGYEMAGDGTMEDSWNKSGLESGNIGIYYGHTDDFSTPGFRRGAALPVSLSSFRPVRDKATGEVVVRWITASELNNAGFNILRSETKTGNFKVINVKGIIPGHGTTSEKHVYEWTDTTAKPNIVYYYRIEDVSFDGERATLATTHLRGNVNAAGKATTTWGDLKNFQ